MDEFFDDTLDIEREEFWLTIDLFESFDDESLFDIDYCD